MTSSQPCHSCRRLLLWLPHEKTKNTAPIEAHANPKGNVHLLARAATGELFAIPYPELNAVAYRVLGKKDLEAYRALSDEERAKLPVYLNHFASCPDAARHHKSA